MINKKNISRDDIANAINKDFGFNRKQCLDFVNDIFELIIEGLETSNKVKIHNFGTFTLRKKKERLGRNPKTREEVTISSRYVITFKASKILLKSINLHK